MAKPKAETRKSADVRSKELSDKDLEKVSGGGARKRAAKKTARKKVATY